MRSCKVASQRYRKLYTPNPSSLHTGKPGGQQNHNSCKTRRLVLRAPVKPGTPHGGGAPCNLEMSQKTLRKRLNRKLNCAVLRKCPKQTQKAYSRHEAADLVVYGPCLANTHWPVHTAVLAAGRDKEVLITLFRKASSAAASLAICRAYSTSSKRSCAHSIPPDEDDCLLR